MTPRGKLFHNLDPCSSAEGSVTDSNQPSSGKEFADRSRRRLVVWNVGNVAQVINKVLRCEAMKRLVNHRSSGNVTEREKGRRGGGQRNGRDREGTALVLAYNPL